MGEEPTQRQLDEELWVLASGRFPDDPYEDDSTALAKWEGEKTKEAACARIVELYKKGANPNWVHPKKPQGRAYQFTSLHIAADKGGEAMVKCLVNECKADINKRQPQYGETPLQHIDGRTGNGREQIYAFLKMKAAMQAAVAAQKFKTAGKKGKGSETPAAGSDPVAAS